MGKVIAGMAMSLDGFVEDRHGSVAALYPDLAALRETAPLKEAIRDTGAVVMGWRAFAMAPDPDAYAGNYEFQVPIFVVSHRRPDHHPKESPAADLHVRRSRGRERHPSGEGRCGRQRCDDRRRSNDDQFRATRRSH